jgi:hypothetical protein
VITTSVVVWVMVYKPIVGTAISNTIEHIKPVLDTNLLQSSVPNVAMTLDIEFSAIFGHAQNAGC